MEKGDIVRFLNSIGGGKVVGFQNNKIALIQDEEGFEIPTLISECVVVEKAKNVEIKVTNPDEIEFSISIKKNDAKYELSAINSSDYSLFINFCTKDRSDRFITQFAGIVYPSGVQLLFSFDSSFFNKYSQKSIIRISPFKQTKSHIIKPMVEKEIRLEKLIQSKGDLILIPEIESKTEPTDKLNTKQLLANFVKTPTNKIDFDSRIEVDLHAEKILPSVSGMQGSDILIYQIDYFRAEMDRYYKKNPGKKVTFIHGKGDGILRESILKDLKYRYPSVKSKDTYDFAATEITF